MTFNLIMPKLLLQQLSTLAIRGQAFLQEPPHRIVGGHHGRLCGRQVRGPPEMMTGSGTWTGLVHCANGNENLDFTVCGKWQF